jgi:hypothetical protein
MCFEKIKPSFNEVNRYALEMIKRHELSLETLNKVGHNFAEWVMTPEEEAKGFSPIAGQGFMNKAAQLGANLAGGNGGNVEMVLMCLLEGSRAHRHLDSRDPLLDSKDHPLVDTEEDSEETVVGDKVAKGEATTHSPTTLTISSILTTICPYTSQITSDQTETFP